MVNSLSLGIRWGAYRPTKGIWFWSCAGSCVATVIVGFAWGGWVTGGTATRMATDEAYAARAQLAAASCVIRFNQGSEALAQLAALKNAQSYQRSDMLTKNGWVTIAGDNEPVAGAADICAQKLLNPDLKTATNGESLCRPDPQLRTKLFWVAPQDRLQLDVDVAPSTNFLGGRTKRASAAPVQNCRRTRCVSPIGRVAR